MSGMSGMPAFSMRVQTLILPSTSLLPSGNWQQRGCLNSHPSETVSSRLSKLESGAGPRLHSWDIRETKLSRGARGCEMSHSHLLMGGGALVSCRSFLQC